MFPDKVSHDSAADIGGKAPVLAGVSTASHGIRTEKPWFTNLPGSCPIMPVHPGPPATHYQDAPGYTPEQCELGFK